MNITKVITDAPTRAGLWTKSNCWRRQRSLTGYSRVQPKWLHYFSSWAIL